MAANTERLDQALVRRGLAPTRTKAQALILAGRVECDGTRVDKPGSRIAADSRLLVRPGPRYVGRGGFKLASALDSFAVDPAGLDALDVGASTGGFTQVLLERGAARVIALDVGRGQLDWGLRNDRRVHVLEGVNARHLEPSALPFPPSLAVIDVSFISVSLVLPAVASCLRCGGEIVVLVKPQFEVGRREVGRGGLVRSPVLHEKVLRRIVAQAVDHEWGVAGVAASTLRGAEGNQEFFLHLTPDRPGLGPAAIARAVTAAVRVGQESRP